MGLKKKVISFQPCGSRYECIIYLLTNWASSVGHQGCPWGDASIRSWQGLPSGYVLWNQITNSYSRLAGTTFWDVGRPLIMLSVLFKERHMRRIIGAYSVGTVSQRSASCMTVGSISKNRTPCVGHTGCQPLLQPTSADDVNRHSIGNSGQYGGGVHVVHSDIFLIGIWVQ
ncbi:hypothetical protein Tco_0622974, partial [Tanacetum coccineum]